VKECNDKTEGFLECNDEIGWKECNDESEGIRNVTMNLRVERM
jgi:hypothetical protein